MTLIAVLAMNVVVFSSSLSAIMEFGLQWSLAVATYPAAPPVEGGSEDICAEDMFGSLVLLTACAGW